MKIVLRKSYWKSSLLSIGSGALACVVMTLPHVMNESLSHPNAIRGMTRLAIVFIILSVLASAWNLFHSSPSLEIDDEGITDHTNGVGRILWEDITGASVQGVPGKIHIHLQLVSPAKYLHRRGITTSVPAGAPISLDLTDVAGADPQNMLEIIRGRSEQARHQRREEDADE